MNTVGCKRILSASILTTSLVTALSCSGDMGQMEERPNILLLLVDDLGYAELGCYGQQIIETPNLDRLASMGVRFSDYHAGNAVSSASRAVLMTGIPSGHNTIRGNMGINLESGGTRVALKKREVTLAEMLKGAGYQTAFIGKWHLESPDDLSTWAFARGFDYAVQEQWSDVITPRNFTVDVEYVNGLQDSIHYDCKKWNCKDEFRTNIAFDYLDTQYSSDKPLFLFMSYRAPHAHEWYINNKELYADKGWTEAERMHAAKITLLDQQIGRLLDKFESMGILDNTLVVFTSDNGPQHEGHDYDFFKSNGDLRGYKRDMFEGGHRVPLIAYWRDHIDSGKVLDFICGGQDIVPTISEAAGIDILPQVHGLSLLNSIKNGKAPQRESMYWEMLDAGFSRQAVRMGQWKAVRYGMQNKIRLYDLSSDIGETLDVAASNTDVMRTITPMFETMRTKSKHFPRNNENIRDRFLSVKDNGCNIIRDDISIDIAHVDQTQVEVAVEYCIAPSAFNERIASLESGLQPYVVSSIIFEDSGVEILRESKAYNISCEDSIVNIQQSVVVDNLIAGKEYYLKSEIVRSTCIAGEERVEILDAVVTPFSVEL